MPTISPADFKRAQDVATIKKVILEVIPTGVEITSVLIALAEVLHIFTALLVKEEDTADAVQAVEQAVISAQDERRGGDE